MLFPRMALFGLATFDAPLDARLREVRDGDLPADLDARLGRAHPLASQEAPARSRLGALVEGTEVILEGCLPGGATWRAEAPRAPRVVLTVDGQATEVVARPQAIRLRPEADELCVTYAVEHKMHRAFIPGVHARIPITTQVERFVARYDAPRGHPAAGDRSRAHVAARRRAVTRSAAPDGDSPLALEPLLELIEPAAQRPAAEVARCVADEHPVLAGRVRCAFDGAGEAWLPCLAGVRPRVGDRVLVLAASGAPGGIVAGVVDGFRRRLDPDPRDTNVRRLKADEVISDRE
jgi:hypothetical protein